MEVTSPPEPGKLADIHSAYAFQSPAVSIIMPSYNCAAFIPAAIQSVIDQSFTDWELIVVDDGSTDASLDIIQSFARADARIRPVCSATNRGAAGARNDALALARGRFIAFLDSDDLWKPEKLARQLAFMDQHGVAFCFTSYERISEDGRLVGTVRVKSPVSYPQLLRGNVIGCLTVVYDTKILGKVEMPNVPKRHDYGLWLALLKKVDTAVPLPDILATYRLRKTSISANKLSAAYHTWRLLRNTERLSLLPASYFFFRYAVFSVWSRYRPQ